MEPKVSSTANHVTMDFPDFIPEEYTVTFSINGHPYAVRYGEARVDEVLPLLADTLKEQSSAEQAASRRKYLTELFQKNLVTGDPVQLAEDLKLVPYVSQRGALDIYTLYTHVQLRVKKKPDLGATTVRRRGLLGFLATWLS